MHYFFSAILLASLLPTGSASAHHMRYNKWHSPVGHHRTYRYVVPGVFYPAPLVTDRHDPYGIGRAAVCCI
jgi:hypothetical protein